jgi:uncharacterized protein YceK
MLRIYSYSTSNRTRNTKNSTPAVQFIQAGFFRSLRKIQPSYLLLGLIVLAGCISLSGCGGVVTNDTTKASTGSVTASPTSIQFTGTAIGATATSQLSLTNSSSSAVVISQLSSNSAVFTVDGEGTLPATLAAGSSLSLNVHFAPTVQGAVTGALTVSNNSLASPTVTVQLSGTGLPQSTAPASALSALSCSSSSVTGAGTDACTVTLSAAAPSGGLAVKLSSSITAVTVPATVTVPAGATSVGFNATIAAVTSAQTATLTSTANGVSKTFGLKLSPAAAGSATGAALTINSSTVAFGNVAIGTPSTQSVTLTSSGTAAVVVSGATVSGSVFTVSGATFPLTLNPSQTATLSVQFKPTASGAATANLTVTSNSASNSTAVVALSGTGVPLAVDLSWSAPSGSDISGYNIYRATGSSSSFSKLNSTVSAPDSFMDATVTAGTTYEYYVTTVDTSGTESTPSNTATVAVP